jgi:hypothetical protein
MEPVRSPKNQHKEGMKELTKGSSSENRKEETKWNRSQSRRELFKIILV